MSDGAGEVSCRHCRAAALIGGLPEIGLSLRAQVIVRRCPICSTYWFETERLAYPVTDQQARSEAPDVVETS